MKKITTQNLATFYCKCSIDEDGRSIDLYYEEDGLLAFRIKDWGTDRRYVFPTFTTPIPEWAISGISNIMQNYEAYFLEIKTYQDELPRV